MISITKSTIMVIAIQMLPVASFSLGTSARGGYLPIQSNRPQHLMDVSQVSRFTPLQMSSIPGDDEGGEGQENMFQIDTSFLKPPKLPPFPENWYILGGDCAFLFFYSFLDHFVNNFYQQAFRNQEPDIVGLHASWIDVAHAMPAEFVQPAFIHTYAPALEYAGISSVLFTGCWLLSGYVNEAFSFKNTVSCTTSHAILVAGKTWVVTAFAMLLIAYGSDVGGMGGLQHQIGGLSQGDLDFVFDSLAVVVMWRAMVSYILGGFM